MKDGKNFQAAQDGCTRLYTMAALKGYTLGLGHAPSEEELTALHLGLDGEMRHIIREAFNVDDPPPTDPTT